MVNKTRGRPSGPSDTRQRILDAARAGFSDRGYARTSLRSIARDADVDHALVSYYFGSKEGLFKAVAELVFTPAEVLDSVIARAPRERLAQTLLEAVTGIWEEPEYQHGLAHLVGDALASPPIEMSFREYLQTEMVARLAGIIGGAEASKRAAAVGSVIAGLYFTRYVLKIEPIASMSRTDLVKHHRPAIEALLIHRAAHRPNSRR